MNVEVFCHFGVEEDAVIDMAPVTPLDFEKLVGAICQVHAEKI